MILTYQNADVTALSKNIPICHCISTDCAMGKGVVLAVRKKHPGIKAACQAYAAKCFPLGTAFRYEDVNGICYNLFSKTKYWHNAANMPGGAYYRNLEACLVSMAAQMRAHSETTLAMPRIGSGLDRGRWDIIESLIKSVFEDENIHIIVCDY